MNIKINNNIFQYFNILMYVKKFRIKKVNLLKIVNNYYQKTAKHQIEVTEMNQILIKITKQFQNFLKKRRQKIQIENC